jgi:hypothetical protein
MASETIRCEKDPLGWGLSWGSRLITSTLPAFGLLIAAALDGVWKKKWLPPIPALLGLNLRRILTSCSD